MNILDKIKKIFPTPSPMQFSTQELKNSTRIFKSTTPEIHYRLVCQLDCIYIHINCNVCERSLVDYIYIMICYSMIVFSMVYVPQSYEKDRALIMLNIVGFLLVLRNFLETLDRKRKCLRKPP